VTVSTDGKNACVVDVYCKKQCLKYLQCVSSAALYRIPAKRAFDTFVSRVIVSSSNHFMVLQGDSGFYALDKRSFDKFVRFILSLRKVCISRRTMPVDVVCLGDSCEKESVWGDSVDGWTLHTKHTDIFGIVCG